MEKSAFRMLIDGLPANRIEAWRFLQPFRRKASEAPTGAEAESVFRNKFELSLEDLLVLSSNPHWEGRSFGGNRWAQIDEGLIALRDAIDIRKHERVAELIVSLPKMAHNTGNLADQLRALDEAIERARLDRPCAK